MALPEQLTTLVESLTSALDCLPSSSKLLPEEGISLLSTKNELLISYLQNLILLVILKIRGIAALPNESSSAQTFEEADSLDESIVEKLITLRIYLEKGIRPLESRLKYQLDKLLAVASEPASGFEINHGTDCQQTTAISSSDAGPVPSSHRDNPNEDISIPSKIAPLAHRPNPASFLAPYKDSTSRNAKAGLYRPPHIMPTSMAPPFSKKERTQRPRKSATLEEYVREEMGDVPVTEPSIGAGSGLRGKAAEKERERADYEEGRLVRLPSERGKKRRVGGEDFFGGVGLADGFDLDLGGEAKRVKRGGEDPEEVLGAKWEKRKKRGVSMGKRRK